MQNVSTHETKVEIEKMISDKCFLPFVNAINSLEEQRLLMIKTTDTIEKYTRRAKTVELAWGFFTGLSGALLSLSAYSLIQGNYSLALGFLGPALASLVGVWGFRISRFIGR